ncbi:hypothetical protein K435DRAFT_905390 [Dendrothele bispora CBS 962.96]|uniref:Uncharacterized protein n=1 Tax=Dendrothele bispora (strain CBS 962.96) TaxID=1314807 RepID=A0A4S8LUM6_DENBC|nr:hypothetical protein K435DRAFT_905390 [Dendrothele bispora CBS 962.96]
MLSVTMLRCSIITATPMSRRSPVSWSQSAFYGWRRARMRSTNITSPIVDVALSLVFACQRRVVHLCWVSCSLCFNNVYDHSLTAPVYDYHYFLPSLQELKRW